MKKLLAAILGTLAALGLPAADLPTVLVYTRNGPTLDGKKGFVHDNIPTCVRVLAKLGEDNGFATVHSEDPTLFTPDSLKKFRAIVFANSNNRAFDTEEQKKAFQDYLQGGGGFVGIHSACGSERNWPWYWSMLGGTFVRHPPIQPFTMNVLDQKHPSTAHLGEKWDWEDEFYYLKEMPGDLHVLLEGDLSTLLKDPAKPKDEKSRPIAWCHDVGQGRSWYTALGHKKEYYENPVFQKHLLGGIKWAMKAE